MASIAERLPDVEFWLLSNGTDWPLVEAFCRERGLTNVWMPGFVTEPIQYLAAGDVYLSTSRWEGLPAAMLDAMSLGKTVVASDVTGNRDAVLDGETGFLYPLGNPGRAAEILGGVANDTELRIRMGSAARHRQRHSFSVEAMVAATQALYTELLKR